MPGQRSSTDRAIEADPEAEGKPDSVTEVEKPTWRYILRKTVREFSDDECMDLAAALTYYAILALAPATLAVLSILGLIGQDEQGAGALLDIAGDVAPGAASTIEQLVSALSQNQASGWGLVIGLGGALWSASGYIGAFGRSMNRIYEIDEGRPFYKLRPVMLVITLVAVVLAGLVALALVVSGPVAQSVGETLGLGDTVVTVWNIVKWPLILAVVILVVAILYYATPNVKQPKFRWVSIGAAVAVLGWVLASVGFGLYVANFSNYDSTYGPLAGFVILLLWLWITNLALLFGAEFDSEIERGRQLQAGMPAEDTLQLPPKDTKVIEKTAAKDDEDRKVAAQIRASADPHDNGGAHGPT